jgi:hypothetical protein
MLEKWNDGVKGVEGLGNASYMAIRERNFNFTLLHQGDEKSYKNLKRLCPQNSPLADRNG